MEQTLATCATAYVTADTGRRQWSIGNDKIRKTLAWHADGGLHLAVLENRTSGHVWRPALNASPFAGGEFLVQWGDVPHSGRQATDLLGIDARADTDAVILYVALRVTDGLDVTLCCLSLIHISEPTRPY